MSIFAGAVDYFVKGGPCMWPLLMCSFAAIAIGVERYLFYKKAISGEKFASSFCRMMNDFNLVGLLGTITGMISSFNALNERTQNPMAVTAGIGEALITTVFGLCIAIMGMCIHAYLMSKIKTETLNINEVADTLVDIFKANEQSK